MEIDKACFFCPVCYCEVDTHVGMECGHKLCEECFTEYLKNAVQSGPDSIFTTCPERGCKLLVSESIFKRLVDSEMLDKYNYYFRKAYVDMN